MVCVCFTPLYSFLGDKWGKVKVIQYKSALNLERSKLPAQFTEAPYAHPSPPGANAPVSSSDLPRCFLGPVPALLLGPKHTILLFRELEVIPRTLLPQTLRCLFHIFSIFAQIPLSLPSLSCSISLQIVLLLLPVYSIYFPLLTGSLLKCKFEKVRNLFLIRPLLYPECLE